MSKSVHFVCQDTLVSANPAPFFAINSRNESHLPVSFSRSQNSQLHTYSLRGRPVPVQTLSETSCSMADYYVSRHPRDSITTSVPTANVMWDSFGGLSPVF